MLDIKLIREKPDFVRQRLATRGRGDEAHIAEIAALDEQRRKLVVESDNLKAERNKVSKEIGVLKAKGGDPIYEAALKERMRVVGERVAALDAEVAGLDERLQQVLLILPNLPHESVAVGKGAADNPEVRRWGEAPKFAFPAKPHWDIGEKLGILDFARATKISGSGFILYKGAGGASRAGVDQLAARFAHTRTRVHGSFPAVSCQPRSDDRHGSVAEVRGGHVSAAR